MPSPLTRASISTTARSWSSSSPSRTERRFIVDGRLLRCERTIALSWGTGTGSWPLSVGTSSLDTVHSVLLFAFLLALIQQLALVRFRMTATRSPFNSRGYERSEHPRLWSGDDFSVLCHQPVLACSRTSFKACASEVQGECRAELARAMLSRSLHSPMHLKCNGKVTKFF